MRWYKKLVSLDSPVFREIFKQISFNRLLAVKGEYYIIVCIICPFSTITIIIIAVYFMDFNLLIGLNRLID